MDARPVKSTSKKPTWAMNSVELAKVVAEHFQFTIRGPWIRDDRGVPVALGWEHLADKLAKRKFIVEGKGVNWRPIGSRLRLPRVTRTPAGHWN